MALSVISKVSHPGQCVGALKVGDDHFDQVGLSEHVCRQVNRHIHGQSFLMPNAALQQRRLQSPKAQGLDQSRLFGELDELTWWKKSISRVKPAHQSLHTLDGARAQIDFWLVVQQELVLLDPPTQLTDECHADRLEFRAIRSVDEAADPISFRCVHGDVGALEYCDRVIGVAWAQCYPDASPHIEGVSLDHDRLS